MGRPSENAVCLSFPIVDIGNTGANVAAIVVPFQCVVDKVVAAAMSAAATSLAISVDSLSNGTAGAADVASITIPASASAGHGYYDTAGRGKLLNAGDCLLLQVDTDGDSGEYGIVSVFVNYEPETEANDTATLTETA